MTEEVCCTAGAQIRGATDCSAPASFEDYKTAQNGSGNLLLSILKLRKHEFCMQYILVRYSCHL
jgi:hypothetical protein